MQQYYYINAKNKKDGPHGLVTIMRRIRSGIITPDTLACQGEDEMIPAQGIEDFAAFFNRPFEDIRHELTVKPRISIVESFRKGWQFTLEHQGMPVFAGGILLLASMVGILAQEIFHSIASGITAGLLMFLFLQSCFFAVSLRLYRGQRTDLSFIEYTLAPIMGKLAFISVMSAFFIIAGLPLIFPSIVAMLICSYMPMFILDYNFTITKTVGSIFSLLKKLNATAMINLGFLVLLYMVCVALVIPIPVIMPIMAGSLCSIYEELSS